MPRVPLRNPHELIASGTATKRSLRDLLGAHLRIGVIERRARLNHAMQSLPYGECAGAPKRG
jgi:hypothetical protein